MNGPTQPEINPLWPTISPALGENTKELMILWTAEMEWRALEASTSNPVSDALLAVRHDVAAVEVKRPLHEEDDPILPVRSDLPSGERFHGKHGNFVVTKGK